MANRHKDRHQKGKDVMTVFKYGSSLAVAIPKAYVRQAELAKGSKMEFHFNSILIGQPVTPERIDKEAVELVKKAGYPIKA